jgi:AcrR family transcriptional regulator
MPSQRHTDDLVLDAVKASVLDVGLRRTTLAEVARRAGVSRMTLYRTYGDLSAIVSALLTRELLGLVDQARADTADLPTARERLVHAGVEVVQRLALVVDRFGASQRAIVEVVAEQVRQGQADGSVRDGDAELLATCLLLTAQSFVFSARVIADRKDATGPELARLLEGYLR